MTEKEKTAISEKDQRDRYLEKVLAAYKRYYNIISVAELLKGQSAQSSDPAQGSQDDQNGQGSQDDQNGQGSQDGKNSQGSQDWQSRRDVPTGLVCRCDFDVRSAQYILSKKHELWSADSHEYCYIFSLPSLTEETYREAERYVYEEGMKLIHPAKGQMCTTLTLLIVCDSADSEAVRLLKKCRLHKNFRFTLDGWMDFHTGLAVLRSGQTACNFGGHDNEKLLRQLLKSSPARER